MADLGSDPPNIMDWPYVVLVPERNVVTYDAIFDWITRDEIAGEFAWETGPVRVVGGKPEWDHDSGNYFLVVGLNDANAAFEFKMRWA